MRNNRGFATIGLVFSILIIISIIMATFFNPMLNTTQNVKNAENDTLNYTKSLAGKERLYSKLKENISYSGKLVYEDVNVDYDLRTIKEDYEAINLTLGNNQSFNINNSTDIKIELNAVPIDNKKPCSYDVVLKNDGENILDESSTNLTNNTIIEVGENFIYNKSTDKTRYGDYILNINSNNCNVKANISFNRLKYRELELINNGDKDVLVIKNENIGNQNIVSVYYK